MGMAGSTSQGLAGATSQELSGATSQEVTRPTPQELTGASSLRPDGPPSQGGNPKGDQKEDQVGEEVFLADESRWGNMRSEANTTEDSPIDKRLVLNDKYQRLLKAKEQSDIRLLDLHDKNAELNEINRNQADKILRLENKLKQVKLDKPPTKVVNDEETINES